MTEGWYIFLLIFGILLLLIGIGLAIWASYNKKTYWYYLLIAGIGLLFLLIALVLYFVYYDVASTEPTCVYKAKSEPSSCRKIEYRQPIIDGNPCYQPQHTFITQPIQEPRYYQNMPVQQGMMPVVPDQQAVTIQQGMMPVVQPINQLNVQTQPSIYPTPAIPPLNQPVTF